MPAPDRLALRQAASPTVFSIGNPRERAAAAPVEVSFWLSIREDGTVGLHAKHSEDVSDQTLLEIEPCGTQRYAVKRRNIYARRLAAFLGLECMGRSLPAYAEPRDRKHPQ